MNLAAIRDLENKVDRVVKLVAKLKEENKRLVRENNTLRRQLDDFRCKMNAQQARLATKSGNRPTRSHDFDSQAVKKRLEKLLGELAILEDTWN